MKYTVDLIIRVWAEGEDKKAAELAAAGTHWDDAGLVAIDSIPEGCVIRCEVCGATVNAYDMGFDDNLYHFANCTLIHEEA